MHMLAPGKNNIIMKTNSYNSGEADLFKGDFGVQGAKLFLKTPHDLAAHRQADAATKRHVQDCWRHNLQSRILNKEASVLSDSRSAPYHPSSLTTLLDKRSVPDAQKWIKLCAHLGSGGNLLA